MSLNVFFVGRQRNGFRYTYLRDVNDKPAYVTTRGDQREPTDRVYFLFSTPDGRYVATEANRNTEAHNFPEVGAPRFRTRNPVANINVADWFEWQVWDDNTNDWSQEFQWHENSAPAPAQPTAGSD